MCSRKATEGSNPSLSAIFADPQGRPSQCAGPGTRIESGDPGRESPKRIQVPHRSNSRSAALPADWFRPEQPGETHLLRNRSRLITAKATSRLPKVSRSWRRYVRMQVPTSRWNDPGASMPGRHLICLDARAVHGPLGSDPLARHTARERAEDCSRQLSPAGHGDNGSRCPWHGTRTKGRKFSPTWSQPGKNGLPRSPCPPLRNRRNPVHPTYLAYTQAAKSFPKQVLTAATARLAPVFAARRPAPRDPALAPVLSIPRGGRARRLVPADPIQPAGVTAKPIQESARSAPPRPSPARISSCDTDRTDGKIDPARTQLLRLKAHCTVRSRTIARRTTYALGAATT